MLADVLVQLAWDCIFYILNLATGSVVVGDLNLDNKD
jgi:hypothetical protein